MLLDTARRSLSSSLEKSRAARVVGELLLEPVWLLLVPKDKESRMRKRLRLMQSAPDLCSANKRSLGKTTEGAAARVFPRAWLWGRCQSKGSCRAQGTRCHFQPTTVILKVFSSLVQSVLPRKAAGTSSQGWVLPEKGFAWWEMLMFPLLLAPRARSTPKL